MLFLVALLCLGTFQAQAIKTERDLKQYLFHGYDKDVRPVKDPDHQIVASAGIRPIALREMNEKEQIIALETFTMVKWQDEFLQWDPQDYNNITILRVPSSLVWKPDLSLYGATPESSLFPVDQGNVLIYSSGTVMWVPLYTMRSRCPVNLKFSKDFVECNLQLGSWTYSGPLLDVALYSEKVDMSDFLNNHPEWKLVEIKSNRVSKYYPCCPEDYPVLNFNVTLKKRWSATPTQKIFYTTKDL